MPQFHRMMGERLRRVEQGADTVVVGFVEGCRQNPQGAVLSRSVGSLL